MPNYNSPVKLNRVPVQDLVPHQSVTAPTTPVSGQLWTDTSLTPPRLKVFENGAWVFASQTGAELLANKNAASGYAGLDAGSKVAIGQVPTGQTGTTVPLGNDARFTDQRVPTDGSVTGGTAGAGVKIAAATITDVNVAAANKDGAVGVPSLRTLGTGATQAAAGTDARLSDQRVPTDGSVTGGTTGAGVKIAVSTITDVNVAAANKDGAAGTPSLRTLGTGAAQALGGTTPLSTIAAPNANVGLAGFKITNLADPTSVQDAATKNYVDLSRQGIRLKDAVKAASAGANINLAAPGATLDGYTFVNAGIDRFLAKDQTTASTNGIYIWNGAASAATRATDADTAAEVNDGATTFIQEGTSNNATTWAQTLPVTTIGTDAQNWAQQGSATAYVGGAGLTLTGQTFDVVALDGSITVAADSITVGLVPIAKGGTGATTAAGARTALGTVGKFSANVGALVAGTELVIAHNLNTPDIDEPAMKNIATGFFEGFDFRVVDANNVGVTSAVAYGANTFRIVVVG